MALYSLKSLGSILFILFVAFQAVHLPILSIWLSMNQEYIAENLCVNRFEPELMCSGRCYVNELTEEAIGQQSQSNQTSATTIDWYESLSPFLLVRTHLPICSAKDTGIQLFTDARIYHFTYINAVFHPPRLA
jgi:hypothetical protein